MGLWDKIKDVGEKVGKYGAPIVYYPTKAVVAGGRKLFDGGNPVSGAMGAVGLGGGGGSASPNFGVANYGGTPDTAVMYRGQMQQGILQGQGMIGTGTGTMQGAAMQTVANRQQANQMYGTGALIGSQGLSNQNAAIGGMLSTAGLQGPSVAALQMQQGLGQTQQAMMAQAAAARGGNQAAAMRNAQAQGSAMAMDVNAQAAQLRAAEEQARINRVVGAQQAAAGMYGEQAGLGFNVMDSGAGYNIQNTGQLAQIGQGVGQLGTAQTGQYLGALSDQAKSEMVARTDLENTRIGGVVQQRANNQAFMGGVVGAAGGVLGAYYGGPAGAAAGYQAGNAVGRKAAG